MRLLVLHLSDMHLHSDTDTVLPRAESILPAIRDLGLECGDACILLFSGDIVQSGAESEYAAARNLIADLQEELRSGSGLNCPVQCAVVPGNHDCDFSTPHAARQLLIPALSSSTSQIDESIIQVCTDVQSAFFDFRDVITEPGDVTGNRLYYEYAFDCAGEQILIRCCNTAWSSQLHEKPGSLAYPVSAIPDQVGAPSLVITVFHHPYGWFTPQDRRPFQRRVEEVSDIVITGHEHDFTFRAVHGRNGERNLYIEGAALQDHSRQEESGFNAILIDTRLRKQRVLSFQWNGHLYQAEEAGWEDYQVNRLRSKKVFQPNDEFSTTLDASDIDLAHPAKGQLTLSDVFVWPDFRDMSTESRELHRIIRGETLIQEILRLRRVLITGAEKSGKTCLAKRLFLAFRERGFVPIILDGATLSLRDDDAIHSALLSAFQCQYRRDQVELYRQLEPARRVVIVDDYHNLRVNRPVLKGAVQQMERFAQTVILMANDLAEQVAEIVTTDRLTDGSTAFAHYRIAPFGHVLRNDLAEKWFGLDQDLAGDKSAFARKLVDARRVMDTIIGKNFVPSYPVFILPLLQAQEHNEPVDLNASTYGYFYELLIRRSLALAAARQGFDILIGYLAFVAYKMFALGTAEIAESDFRAIHSEYETTYAMRLSFVDLQNNLCAARILHMFESRFCFRYDYIYYYFVASYIRDHITEKTMQEKITQLAGTLHQEESANILLFLAHLSKHPHVVQSMLDSAKRVFTESARAELAPAATPLAELDRWVTEVAYEERDGRESRRSILKHRDARDADARETADAAAGDERADYAQTLRTAREHLIRLEVAFKTLQILGQILKNFPGSIEGAIKKRITDECYGIGLRTIDFLFRVLGENAGALAESLVATLREEHPHLTGEDLSTRARQSFFGLTFLVAYGMVRRVSHAVGSPRLMQIYESLLKEHGTTAVALITTSLRLEQCVAFPADDIEAFGAEIEKNTLAMTVLRCLVISHFYLYDVRFDVKQRICDKLGISYKRLQATDPRLRVISEGD